MTPRERAEELFPADPDPDRHGWRGVADPVATKSRIEEAVAQLIEEGWHADRGEGSVISPNTFEKLARAFEAVHAEARAEEHLNSKVPGMLDELTAAWEERKAGLREYLNALAGYEHALEARVARLIARMQSALKEST